MNSYDDLTVWIRTDWKDWRSSSVRLADIGGVHWHQPSGAPHVLLHGYISCVHLIGGDLPHACDGASAPHQLKVCIVKRQNVATTYAELTRKANDTQARLVLPRPDIRMLSRVQVN